MTRGRIQGQKKQNKTVGDGKTEMPRKRRSEQRALRFIVPAESTGSIVQTFWARAGSPLGRGEGGGIVQFCGLRN